MSFESAASLNDYPLLRSDSFEEVQSLLSGKRLNATRPGLGQTQAIVNGAYFPNLYIAYMDYGAALRIDADAGREEYTVFSPCRGQVKARVGHDDVECSSDVTAVLSPHADQTTWTEDGATRINLTINQDALTAQLSQLLGEAVNQPLAFSTTMQRRNNTVSAFFAYLDGVIDSLELSPNLLTHELMTSQMEQALMTALLLAQPNNYSDKMQRLNQSIASRDVKRVLDYIHANLGRAITLADLVTVAGVPGRTLQRHFADSMGCGPMAYLQKLRFQAARDELAHAAPQTTVTDVALKWGFANLGRFSVSYRQMFGESPSETLKRRPS